MAAFRRTPATSGTTIVPLCLGGPDVRANLQYQPWPEARAKDEREREACEAYCRGRNQPRRRTLSVSSGISMTSNDLIRAIGEALFGGRDRRLRRRPSAPTRAPCCAGWTALRRFRQGCGASKQRLAADLLKVEWTRYTDEVASK